MEESPVKKFLRFVASIMVSVVIVSGVAYAGSLTPPSGTPAATSYTLDDIYTRLTTNASTTAGNHTLTLSASPTASFHTLSQIYAAIPTVDPATIATSTVYMGVRGTFLGNIFNGSGQSVTGGSQANGGVNDVNNNTMPPNDRYSTTWTICTSGNNYCGTGDPAANAKDLATGLTWSHACTGTMCEVFIMPNTTITKAVTTNFNNELLIATTGFFNVPGTTASDADSTLAISSASVNSGKQALQYRIAATTGSYTTSLTTSESAASWGAILAAFKPATPGANIQLVQATSTTLVTSSTCAPRLDNVTAGNLLVFAIRFTVSSSSAVTTTTLADSMSNAWTVVATATAPGATSVPREMLFFAPNVTGGTVTATGTLPSSISRNCILAEFSGVATSSPLDTASSIASNSTMGTYSWDNSATSNGGLTASQLCSSHTGWYLPHQKQMMQAYIDGSFGRLTNASSTNYWSATTFSQNTASAWVPDFSSGDQPTAAKTALWKVRCVR